MPRGGIRRLPGWILRQPRSQPEALPKPAAALIPISPFEESEQEAPIPLTEERVVFGRDPAQATWVIEDPSVSAIHARLEQKEDTYWLSDEGSMAGTWVNYSMVGLQVVALEHGDLIHMGRTYFRFTMTDPAAVRKPVILSQEHEL